MGRKRKSGKTFMGLTKEQDRELFKHCKVEDKPVRKFVKEAIAEKLERLQSQ